MKNMMRWPLALLVPALLTVGCSGEEALDPVGSMPEVSTGAVSTLAAGFTGTVLDARGKALAGAQITINGISQLTDGSGNYALTVENALKGYSLTVSKFGFETQGTFVPAVPRNRTIHVLKAAFVAQIDPAKDTTVVDQATGLRVTLKANTLVYADGKRVTSAVRVALAGYQPLDMPGDFTAVNLEGRAVALESVGAFSVSAVDGQNLAVNLAVGATSDAFIPLPAQAGKMPGCISTGQCRAAMWRYDANTGRWVEQRATSMRVGSAGTTFTMTGGPAGGTTSGGLGTWNADLEKATPACTIIEVNSIPPECFSFTLNVNLLNSSGMPVPRSRTIAAGTSFVALYNIPANVEQQVGIEFPAGAPAYCAGSLHIFSNPAPTDVAFPQLTATGGTTKFNAGAPWGGVGFPTDSGGAPIDYADVQAGDYPCKSIVTFSVL